MEWIRELLKRMDMENATKIKLEELIDEIKNNLVIPPEHYTAEELKLWTDGYMKAYCAALAILIQSVEDIENGDLS